MTHKTQPTAHAEITAPISADLRRLPALSEQDAGLLEQAASMLEGLHNDERNCGNCSTAEGAACSAHAVRRLAVQLLRAAPPAPAAVAVPELWLSDEQIEQAFISARDEFMLREVERTDTKLRLAFGRAVLHSARAALAAAPAQEHATQLAGQGGTADAHAAWSAFEKLESDRGAAEPQSSLVRDYLMCAARVGIYRAAAPAQAQEDARDLEAEALRACRDLPEDWEIEIHLERGYGVVTVIDPQGNDDELPVEGTLFDALKESIDTAIRDDAARAAQGGAA